MTIEEIKTKRELLVAKIKKLTRIVEKIDNYIRTSEANLAAMQADIEADLTSDG